MPLGSLCQVVGCDRRAEVEVQHYGFCRLHCGEFLIEAERQGIALEDLVQTLAQGTQPVSITDAEAPRPNSTFGAGQNMQLGGAVSF